MSFTRLRYILLLVSFSGFVATTSAAREVKVRAGEHSGFTRLVFELGQPLPWQISKMPTGYILEIKNPDLKFDLSQVFSKIPRTRIRAIVAKPDATMTQISILSPCACHMKVSEVSQGRLVVDIVDGIRTEAPETVGTFKTIEAAAAKQPDPETAMPNLPQATSPLPSKLRFELLSLKPTEFVGRVIAPAKMYDLPDKRIAESRDRLIRELGRAMTQGLISPSPFVTSHMGKSRESATNSATAFDQKKPLDKLRVAVDPPILVDAKQTPILPELLNLSIQTAIDRDRSTQVPPDQQRSDQANCLSPGDLDVPAWAGSNSFPQELASLRSQLIGEFDKPDRKALQALIKLLIYYGLGTEARALIVDFSDHVSQKYILTEFSYLLESGFVPGGKLLKNQAYCASPGPFWALAAGPKIPVGNRPDIGTIASYFATLPIGLRRRIGAVIGSRLLDAGYTQAAAKIAARVQRASGRHGGAFSLFLARLELKQGRVASARSRLLNIVNTNQENSANAMILLLTSYSNSNEKVPKTLVTEAAALAFEKRKTPVGNALRLIEIEVRAQANDPFGAFASLAADFEAGALSVLTRDKIASKLFMSMTQQNTSVDDLVFLYYRNASYLSSNPDADPSRRHLASIFSDIGLPSETLALLKPIGERQTSNDRLVAANALLAAGAPNAALTLVESLTDARAVDLEANIYLALAEPTLALNTLQDQADDATKQAAAWQSGNFAAISKASLDVRQVAAAYELGGSSMLAKEDNNQAAAAFRKPLVLPVELSLKGLSSLVRQSQNARGFLKSLMKAHPPPSKMVTE